MGYSSVVDDYSSEVEARSVAAVGYLVAVSDVVGVVGVAKA